MEERVNDRKYESNKKRLGKKAECPDDTSPGDIEEIVSDINDDKTEEIDEVKEEECLYDTSPN